MSKKRAHPSSTGPFLSRKHAADILRGDIDSPGSYIEGRIFSTNPRKIQYTIDIRKDSNAKATYLDVFVEDKLQKRLGELLVGDYLQILLQGAQVLPYSGASSHLRVVLRFREGITILLVSRAGLQGERGKLFHVWPGFSTSKAKKRKQALNVDNSDLSWFSSPPPGDSSSGVEECSFGTRTTTAGGRSRRKSPVPSPLGGSSTPTSPTLVDHPELASEAGPSTSPTASIALSSPWKPPLTTGQNRGAATYKYRTPPSHEQSTPAHPTPVPKSSSATNSTILPVATPSTSRQISGRDSAPPSQRSSEPRNCSTTLERPPPGKQMSKRKKRREELKKLAAPVSSTVPATTEVSPTPVKSELAVPTAVGNSDACDLSLRDNGRSELGIDVSCMPADVLPGQPTVAQSEVERVGSGEDIDSTGGIVNLGQDRDDAALSMRAGLIANGWPYTALSKIRHSALMSIIGVVSSAAKEPMQSQKGDWCTCFSLLDPSVLDSFGGVLYVPGAGIKINCFMRVEQWLPNPKQGNIVLLRQVKIQHWHEHLTGTCNPHTMQWAIYDPLTEEVLQPDRDLASHRPHHPPSWHVVPQEKEYCAQLVKWWAAVQRTRVERQGTAVQIGGGPIVASEWKHVHRQHLLISEADPGREPRGYFNCTVEILHGHANQTPDIYSIYVTDYTSKSGTFSEHSSEWCPASLTNRVLRIEMWREKAVALAQLMNPGEYWSLDNVRMKVSNGGYIEGSFSEAAKARKLSVTDVDTNSHLQALLQRKKVWEENDANPHVFPHKLFDAAELQSIFDCTVEVLHAEYNATGPSTVYVTDYTERCDLATLPTKLWSHGLQGRIVTLELQGQQSKMANKMETGSFFAVKHLRLIERVTGVGKVVGRIGGPDRLIHKLNTNNPNEELERLLERRGQWKEASASRRTENFTTIARVLKSDKREDKFRVRARVVGTFPLRLDDCVARCCKGCSGQLPAGMDTCGRCIASNGATAECENVFHLFLRLQDEHAYAQITVAVDQNSSVLRDLTPDDVINNPGYTGIVRERLAGYIGNMEAVQAANSQGRTLEAKVPVREYTIESWYVQDGDNVSSGEGVVAYGLS